MYCDVLRLPRSSATSLSLYVIVCHCSHWEPLRCSHGSGPGPIHKLLCGLPLRACHVPGSCQLQSSEKYENRTQPSLAYTAPRSHLEGSSCIRLEDNFRSFKSPTLLVEIHWMQWMNGRGPKATAARCISNCIWRRIPILCRCGMLHKQPSPTQCNPATQVMKQWQQLEVTEVSTAWQHLVKCWVTCSNWGSCALAQKKGVLLAYLLLASGGWWWLF